MMLGSFIRISLRNLYREKVYALINIAGLSLAIACCLILGLYLRGELTYDQHHENYGSIYRVVNSFNLNGQVDEFAVSSPATGPLMTQDFTELEEYVSFSPAAQTSLLLRHDSDSFYWEQAFYATDNVFDVFTHDIIYGDPATALVDPNSIAISETVALNYFGNINPLGETLTGDDGQPLSVSLVFADLPENTHLKYDILLSANNQRVALPDDVGQLRQRLFGVGTYTYLLMSENFDPADFPAMADSFYERHVVSRGMPGLQGIEYELEALADIHFNSDKPFDEPKGNRAYLYAFGAVAAFILAVACINYMNLATARSIRRSREVGLRKILGANKNVLMVQFLTESLIYAVVATLIAIALVNIVLDMNWISQLLGKTITFDLLQDPQLIFWLVIMTLAIGFLAGIYPAVYLSSWAPLSALVSSGRNSGKGNIRLRQALVLAQFTISIAVIASTLLMADQMRYIADRDLGFEKENRVAIRMVGADLIERSEVIKNELIQRPDILGVTTQNRLIGQNLPVNAIPLESRDGTIETIGVTHLQVDVDYLGVMGLDLVQGRDFSQRLLTDVGTSVLVNQAMVLNQGWDDAIGKRIFDGRVIGVVEDFNFFSLHSAVEPLAIRPFNDNFANLPPQARLLQQRYMVVNISGTNIRDTLAYLQDRFADFDPGHPFEFQFLDDTLDQLYQSETNLMRMLGIFAGVCIFIAALGLFGLASFTTEQRNKEIGIRKVLGASAAQIILLLSKGVLVLVGIGAILASIIAYLAIDEWLASFAYRDSINFSAFFIAALAALALAYLTMALQSWRTAQADPVDAIRTE